MSDRPLLPPRLKDWKEGKSQIGVFLRTKMGGTVAAVHHDATDDEVRMLISIGTGTMRDFPAKLPIRLRCTRTVAPSLHMRGSLLPQARLSPSVPRHRRACLRFHEWWPWTARIGA
jgi:hypothetical protein